MRRTRGAAIREFFDSLLEGDPVALGLVAAIVVVAILLGLGILKIRRNMRREDEDWAKKHGRKRSK